MRPVSLKIKGINSFLEEQTIDFETLTQSGLFGIFGPTGSGKSTILDGITLALYGKISRNSSNYINVNEEKGSVVFEFTISGQKLKNYRVSREFVRSKEGGINQGKCQLVELFLEAPEILADKPTEVTKQCEEIIGLNLTDFTRTVVLPQGKFSDFLKLEGRPRREMLERLFNLSKYGDNLTDRLKIEKSQETENLHQVEGRISVYEGVSGEVQNQKKAEYDTNRQALEKELEIFKTIEKERDEAERLWAFQQELNAALEAEKGLQDSKTEIEEKERRLDQGKKAESIRMTISDMEILMNQITEVDAQLKVSEEERMKLFCEKETVEKDWKAIDEEKNNKLFQYQNQLSKVEDAILLEQQQKLLDEQIKQIKNTNNQCFLQYEDYKKEISEIQESLVEKKKILSENETEEISLRVDASYRDIINKGVKDAERAEKLKDEFNQKDERISHNRSLIQKLVGAGDVLKVKKEALEITIKKYQDQLNNLIEVQPSTRGELQKLGEEIREIESLWTRNQTLSENIQMLQSETKCLGVEIEAKNKVKDKLSKICESVKKSLRQLENENIGRELRNQLASGEPCPVCGSKNHPLKFSDEQGKDLSEKIQKLEEELAHKEKELSQFTEEISQSRGRLSAETNNLHTKETQKEELNTIVKEKKIMLQNPGELKEQLRKATMERETWELLKIEAENQKNLQNQELLVIIGDLKEKTAEIKSLEGQTEEYAAESRQKKEEWKALKADLEKLQTKTAVTDFFSENTRLTKMTMRQNEILIKLKNLRKALETDQNEKDGLNEKCSALKIQMRESMAACDEKKKQREEKRTAIIDKVGADAVPELLSCQKKFKDEINRINTAWSELKKKSGKIQKTYEIVKESVSALTVKLETLEKQNETVKKSMDKQLTILGFKDVAALINAYLMPETMKNEQAIIKKYREDCVKVKGTIEGLNKKINGNLIDAEAYESTNNNYKRIKNQLEILKKRETQLQAELESLDSRLKELQGFLEGKKKIDHQLALITDLEKLFSGKKFVEFMAVARLQYISIEASKRLLEISNGNYGLEADDNGRFIIRDNKNGGAPRDPSTLSGGETFLASLALALALSAEIQLKGRAPLEFFFLDEGFGSLHEDALEVVMNSIEMLHNENLKVGIISHVESIKNRMPVKLLVTPGEAGVGGSHVRIER
ncbi:AAA family ATPase [Acetobacterium paludosum]|uniref:Nuclease SbcCD subunit C n=1 Tax=Acetobacterium paludosum TaxID=52693 RepID=A0A923KVG8_9FIRM|nr:SMC family ATPase [Acetobacterium paludosum]MBC3886983.1 AAA family ATPase [Acetobacterium paludosum]